MNAEPDRQDDTGARNGNAGSGSVRHVDVIGAAPNRTSPMRWVLAIVPALLAILGSLYLAGVWSASLLDAPEDSHTGRQRPVSLEKAARGPPADPNIDARESGFDAGAVLKLIARADVREGASVFKMCAVCHTEERGGPHKVGNNLWNIVGSAKAARPDYRYSQALRAKGGTWTYRELAEYLHNPRTSVPGTSMAFAGIRDNQRMANLLAYMRMLSDRPVPLPR